MEQERGPVEDDGVVPGAETAEDGGTGQDEVVMDLLHEHVPLTLLMDMASPDGPHSQEILEDEGAPEDSWWVQD